MVRGDKMKKLKLIFFTLIVSLLFFSQGFAQTYYFQNHLKLVAQGTSTAANTQLSLVDGTAFVYLVGVDLTAYQTEKHLLAVYNQSTGSLIGMGYCSATAPAGETLGNELQTGWTNLVGTPYETFTSAGLAISEATETGIAGRCLGNADMAQGMLTKYGFTVTVLSGTLESNNRYSWSLSATGNYPSTSESTILTSGNMAGYGVVVGTTLKCGFRSTAEISFAISGYTSKQVLDPPSTGVRIEATPGGAQSWTTKGSGVVNAAVTYKIWSVGN